MKYLNKFLLSTHLYFAEKNVKKNYSNLEHHVD